MENYELLRYYDDLIRSLWIDIDFMEQERGLNGTGPLIDMVDLRRRNRIAEKAEELSINANVLNILRVNPPELADHIPFYIEYFEKLLAPLLEGLGGNIPKEVPDDIVEQWCWFHARPYAKTIEILKSRLGERETNEY